MHNKTSKLYRIIVKLFLSAHIIEMHGIFFRRWWANELKREIPGMRSNFQLNTKSKAVFSLLYKMFNIAFSSRGCRPFLWLFGIVWWRLRLKCRVAQRREELKTRVVHTHNTEPSTWEQKMEITFFLFVCCCCCCVRGEVFFFGAESI